MKGSRPFALAFAVGWGIVGCATIPAPLPPAQEAALHERAVTAVKRAVTYPHLPVVRALGIEVMERHLGAEGLPWIRNALRDRDPTVQYAAILALGALKDRDSYGRVHEFAQHNDATLQAAACYTLHRLGDTRNTGRLAEMLLDNPSPEVRRTAALVLGLLKEPKAVKVLARAMKDEDEFVQQQALESMARLGNPEAVQQLTFSASSGLGAKRVSAIMTLADLQMPSLENTFQYKLTQGEYLDTRLAAAYGLGKLGIDAGFRLALESLDFNRPQPGVAQDPPAAQIRRIRQMAANALGAIGDRRSLAALERRLNDQSDPWVQIAAADAILTILGKNWGPTDSSGGG